MKYLILLAIFNIVYSYSNYETITDKNNNQASYYFYDDGLFCNISYYSLEIYDINQTSQCFEKNKDDEIVNVYTIKVDWFLTIFIICLFLGQIILILLLCCPFHPDYNYILANYIFVASCEYNGRHYKLYEMDDYIEEQNLL